MITRSCIHRIFRYFVVFGVLFLAGCSFFTLPEEEETFLKENSVVGYDFLFDFTGYPYDIQIAPDGWQIVSFYRSLSDSGKDTIRFQTEDRSAAYLTDWESKIYISGENGATYILTRYLNGITEVDGKVYLFSHVNNRGTMVASVHRFDTLTGSVEFVFADSSHILYYTGCDTAYGYYHSSPMNQNYRFDITTATLEAYDQPVVGNGDSVYYNGFKLSHAEDTVYKSVGNDGRREWESPLRSTGRGFLQIYKLAVYDGNLFICGNQSDGGGTMESCSENTGFLLKMDMAGAVVWRHTLATEAECTLNLFTEISFSENGECLSLGITRGGRYSYHYLVYVDRYGTIQREKILSVNDNSSFLTGITGNRILKVEDGVVHLVFTGSSDNGSGRNYYAQVRY